MLLFMIKTNSSLSRINLENALNELSVEVTLAHQ